MPINENGVYEPPTIEEIKEGLQAELLASGVDLNVFDNSNYIQTTNPIVTAIWNLANNLSALPSQIQEIFALQNIQIKRAGIFTRDAILNLLLDDEDIQKADVRNFAAGEVTIYIYNTDPAVLPPKNYDDLTQSIVNVTTVFDLYIDQGSAIANTKPRPNSLETTTVYYNIATEVDIITSDPTNLLVTTYSSIITIDEGIETAKIEAALGTYFEGFKIGQQVDISGIICLIVEVGNGAYNNVTVTFSGAAIATSEIYTYTSSTITYI